MSYQNVNQPLNVGNQTNSSMPVNTKFKYGGNGNQSDEDSEHVSHIIKRQQTLETERLQTQVEWQWIYEVIVPRKSDVITTKLPGSDRNQDVFDTTAILANGMLAAALHSMLTNMAVRFFDLLPENEHEKVDDATREWLQIVGNGMYGILNRSNFQTEIHEIYLDIGSIGTACLYVAEDPDTVVHFNARAMKEIFIDENNLGRVDTVHRKFKWKLRQIVQEFGLDKLPEELQRAHDKGDEQEYEIIHAVCAYTDADRKKGVRGSNFFKFRSTYVLKDRELKLSEGGYREFPFCVPRWTKTSGEKYGRGPGTDALPDILMVNEMKRTIIDGAQKAVNPPFAVTDDGIIGQLRLSPGGITVVRAFSDSPIKPLLAQNPQIEFGGKILEDVQNNIKSLFYVDQLQTPQNPNQTATEVLQRVEEQMRLMGPVLGRQEFELLKPLIEIIYPIMLRRGLIPKPPESFQGKRFSVKYSSLIARTQRMSEATNIARALGVAGPLMQMDPSCAVVLDNDKAVKEIFKNYGVTQTIMRSDADIKKIKQAQAAAQQQAMKQQQQQHQADLVSKIAPGAAQLQQAQQNNQGGNPNQ